MASSWQRVAIPAVPLILLLVHLFYPTSLADVQTVQAAGPVRVEEFVRSLGDQGATVRVVRPVEQPFLRAAAGWLVEVHGVPVQVFEYSTEADRRNDTDGISPDGYRVARTEVAWVDQPHIWASGSLLVVYVGRNQAMAGLLSSVLGEPVAQSIGQPALHAARAY